MLGRAKQGKTERYRRLYKHLTASTDKFEHAEGQRGMVMIVFTLPSYDLVFKIIRDQFAFPKTATRTEVMDRYQLVSSTIARGGSWMPRNFGNYGFPSQGFPAS